MLAIQAEGLSKVYPGGVVGLRSLDLQVRAGELVGLLGPSGSGKTTLFRLLSGALRPSGGRLAVLGQDLRRARTAEVRRLRHRMAIVFQQHNLVPGLSAARNVLLGRLGRAPLWRALLAWAHLPESERRAAFAMLQELEIGDKLYARTDDLSGGQQQRVAIARALLDTPELLLGDEPIASVDAGTASLIMDFVARLNRERGLTAIISLHQADFARRYCPRVLVLARGEVAYDGPPDAIGPVGVSADGPVGQVEIRSISPTRPSADAPTGRERSLDAAVH